MPVAAQANEVCGSLNAIPTKASRPQIAEITMQKPAIAFSLSVGSGI